MGLDFGRGQRRQRSIFKHSRDVETGQGLERVGQSTIIVSLDGTGDTDDIQEAISLLPDDGGEIFIKEGTYRLKDLETISVNKNNVTITGTGAGTVVQSGVFPNLGGGFVFEMLATSGVLIKNMVIDCNEAEQVGTVLSGGVNFQGCEGCTITELIIKNMDEQAAIFIQKFGGRGSNNIITGNVIRDGDGGSGIIMDGDLDIISNNQIFDIDRDAIYVASGEDIVVSNNVISGATINNGIRIDKASGTDARVVVDGNIVQDVGFDGVSINNYTDCIISNNVLMNNGIWGVDISAGCDRIIVMGNQIRGNATGQVRDNGTNTHPNGASGTTNLALDDLNIIA